MAQGLDRRQLLRTGSLLIAAAGAGPLAACSSSDTDTPPAGVSGPPRNGGTLRAAFVGGGAAETLDPFRGNTVLDFSRARAVHASLGDLDPGASEGVRYNVLAGIDNAPDFSSYTLRVRPGLRFTDGSPLTARDVVYSLNFVAEHAVSPSYKLYAVDFDLARARVENDTTIVLPTLRPVTDGRELLCFGGTFVFREGTTAFTVDMPTAGPFRLVEFAAGRGAVLRRNDDFGATDADGPYLAGLELLSIADAQARLNALRAGQADYAHQLTPAQANALPTGPGITVVETRLPAVTALNFSLNMARPPFDDLRVRQAFKLAVNRQEILDNALFGRGHLGNDLYSLGYADYADDIEQRPHDPGRARELLREAGVGDLRITLTTGPENPGMVEAATLYAEHLRQVGVTVTLDERPAGQLYADPVAYAALPFVGGYSPAAPALTYYQFTSGAGNPYAFGWNRPDIDEQVARARQSGSPADATAAQRVLWEQGNAVIPVFKPDVNAHVPNLVGVEKGLWEQFPSFAAASLQ